MAALVTPVEVDGVWYSAVVYTMSGVLSVSAETVVDALLVGGGGGGAGWCNWENGGGGGGAGGFREFSGLVLPPGDYPIVVGKGGAGHKTSYGEDGGITSAFGYEAAGGGGGATRRDNGTNYAGNAGGSGGGGGRGGSGGAGNTPATDPPQGHDGGGPGGGGGAGGPGTETVGGDGRISTITGGEVYYAGGGSRSGTAIAALGGGGFDDGTAASRHGVDGLGGGGAGLGCSGEADTAGNGGSGAVIVRSPGIPDPIAGVVTDAAGNPAARTLRIYDRGTGLLLREITSDASTGAYEIFALGQIQIVALADEDALYNDLVSSKSAVL